MRSRRIVPRSEASSIYSRVTTSEVLCRDSSPAAQFACWVRRSRAICLVHAWNLLLGCVIAELVSLGLSQDAKKCRVTIRHPVAECKAADEDGEAGENAVEEVEGTHGAHADEVKQRALDAQIRERLM